MKFEKVSYEQYRKAVGDDSVNEDLKKEYDEIKIPQRATAFSAGYDFFAPFSFALKPGETIKIPTGIRVLLDEDKFLALYPRSGLGFKFRLQLDNTVGIIDADYSSSDNEGHIFAKITNDGKNGRTVSVAQGQAFMQGVIQQYFKVEGDNVERTRNGGFGSTA